MTAARVRQFVESRPWIWAVLGSLAAWLGTGLLTSRLTLESLSSNAVSAAFLAIAALGQMFVISTGRGAVDLSIPSVITLTAFLSTGIIDGSDSRLIIGVVAALAAGVGVGIVNSGAVILLRIPPIIATLAIGYVLTTAALIYNASFSSFYTSPLLATVTRGRILSFPWIILVALMLGLLSAFILNRTAYGRALMAVGQNIRAAHLAGVKVNRTLVTAYIASGVFASLAGVLIAARVGGAFLGMGQPYLLESVGAVVIGGTLIFGGRATALGTLFGALFLVLIVTAMEVAGVSLGVQNIVKGALIILVLIVATANPKERKQTRGAAVKPQRP